MEFNYIQGVGMNIVIQPYLYNIIHCWNVRIQMLETNFIHKQYTRGIFSKFINLEKERSRGYDINLLEQGLKEYYPI